MADKKILEQIKNESEPKLLKGDASEMTDIIFDTLFGNTQYPQFDIGKTTPIDEQGDCQACDGRRQYIRFGYCGHEYRMEIKLVSNREEFGDVPHKVVSLRKANEIIQRGGIVDAQTKGNVYAEFDYKCRQAGLSEVFTTKSKFIYEYMLRLLIYCDAKGYEDEANCNFEIRFK